MVDLSTILAGLSDAFTLWNLAFVIFGVTLGQLVAAIPGIGPVMAIAIAIPFTFALDPLPAIAFLVGVAKGGTVGGAVPAILINTPGTPDSAATALDGHPLARQGKPLKATKMALFSSVTGDTFSDIVLITVSAPLAILALRMGPVEVFALMVFAFAVISGLVGKSLLKGAIAAALGLLVSTIGADPENYSPRLIFGNFALYDGLPLASVALGMLAISEILTRLARNRGAHEAVINLSGVGDPADQRVSWAEYWACRYTLLRGAVIGTLLGATPGIGSTAAAFMSYSSTKAASKDPDSFGKGNIQGIAATESANSAVVGSNLIPLLTLGIPGSGTTAILLGALIALNVTPGPRLMIDAPQIFWAVIMSMFIGNLVLLILNLPLIPYIAKVLAVPRN